MQQKKVLVCGADVFVGGYPLEETLATQILTTSMVGILKKTEINE